MNLIDFDIARAEQTARALAEEAAAYIANRPARDRNRVIRERNERLKKAASKCASSHAPARLRNQMQPLEPLPVTLSDETKRVIAAESDNRMLLRGVTQDEWRRRVEQLPDDLRVTIACIIWWDYFAERLSAERWGALDSYISGQVSDFPPRELAAALIACGYTPYAAMQRVEPKTYEETNEEAA